MQKTGFQKYELGHSLLDHEHNQLFLLMERLGFSCTKRETEDILQALTDYAVGHFHEEEQLMEMYGYPEMKEHLAQHESFRKDIESHASRFAEEGIDVEAVCKHLAKALPAWLAKHIATIDRKLVAFVNEKEGRIVDGHYPQMEFADPDA